jgi:hypothetical protein
MDFEVIGTITAIELIASGQGIRVRRRLGTASPRCALPMVRYNTAEIPLIQGWYEAHGIGRKEFKLKLPLLD